MSEHQFIKSYLNDFSDLLRPNDVLIEKLIQVRDLLLEVNQNNKKILIFGNGGSAAIASHFSVDLTKNAKVRCLNLNEAGLITCFSNDYGFEHWAEKAIDFYVANNLKLAMKLKATGIYISAYNKQINYSKVNYANFKIKDTKTTFINREKGSSSVNIKLIYQSLIGIFKIYLNINSKKNNLKNN